MTTKSGSTNSFGIVDRLINLAETLAGSVKNAGIAGVIIIFILVIVAILLRGSAAIALYVIAGIFGVLITIIALTEMRNKSRAGDQGSGTRSNFVRPGNTVELEATLTTPQKNDIVRAMKGAIADVAQELDVHTPGLIRANLFGIDETATMRMLPELAVNMDRPREFTLSMPVGYGSTGTCFHSRMPNIAVLGELKDWGEFAVPATELPKAHPDLKWILSHPILVGDANEPLWVLNVDGLQTSPEYALLEKAARRLPLWAAAVRAAVTG